jgi:hypothetical protein
MPYDRKASLKLTFLKKSKNSTMEIPCKGFIWKKSNEDLNL